MNRVFRYMLAKARGETEPLLPGPVAGILGQRFQVRYVVIIGIFVSFFSVLACCISKSFLVMILCWGGLNGIGTSLTTTLLPVQIDQHFERYKVSAMGISYFGGCAGSLLFSFVLEARIHEQGINIYFFVWIVSYISLVFPSFFSLKTPSRLRENPQFVSENS
ncbi:monocarboxylate transporter 5, partial [Nephila pilipes]